MLSQFVEIWFDLSEELKRVVERWWGEWGEGQWQCFGRVNVPFQNAILERVVVIRD